MTFLEISNKKEFSYSHHTKLKFNYTVVTLFSASLPFYTRHLKSHIYVYIHKCLFCHDIFLLELLIFERSNIEMGNSIGRGRKAKVMKIDGETFKLKTPARACDVVKDYPGHVLLDSEAVKHFGIRAKPLDSEQELKPKKIYFLVELPKFPEEKDTSRNTRRVRSGIYMSAKDRLECLMLSRRSVSDLSIARSLSTQVPDGPAPVRLKMRLPKAQVEKLVEESKDESEVAEKIVDLFLGNSGEINGRDADRREGQWRPELGSIGENLKPREVWMVSLNLINLIQPVLLAHLVHIHGRQLRET